jgi:hypothetical protein
MWRLLVPIEKHLPVFWAASARDVKITAFLGVYEKFGS